MSPAALTLPVTEAPLPTETSVNVDAEIDVALIDSENVTVKVELVATFVAADVGFEETTVGGVVSPAGGLLTGGLLTGGLASSPPPPPQATRHSALAMASAQTATTRRGEAVRTSIMVGTTVGTPRRAQAYYSTYANSPAKGVSVYRQDLCGGSEETRG